MNNGIPYNGELIDVDALEYAEWEDALDNVVGKTKADRKASEEWITYRCLMNNGYLVKQPTSKEPTGDSAKSNVPSVDTNLPRSNLKREPKWSPSQIIREREKLVRLQERQLAVKKKRFIEEQERLIDEKYNQPIPHQFYHGDGRPYSRKNYISAIIALLILLCMSVICCALKMFA